MQTAYAKSVIYTFGFITIIIIVPVCVCVCVIASHYSVLLSVCWGRGTTSVHGEGTTQRSLESHTQPHSNTGPGTDGGATAS